MFDPIPQNVPISPVDQFGGIQTPQQMPQQVPPELQHMNDVFNQYTQQKQQNQPPSMLQGILQNRMQPTMGDTATSIMRETQSYASPQGFTPYSPEGVMADRVKNELAPYTSVLETQNKASNNLMQQAGGATGILINRYMAEHPGSSFSDALTAVQAGPALTRMGLQLGPNNTVSTMQGAPESLGTIKQAEGFGSQQGKNTSDLGMVGPIATQKSTAEESTKATYAPKIAAGTKAGEQLGTTEANLRASMAQYPMLQQTAQRLSDLGKTATYTEAGQAVNTATRQVGMPVSQGAIDRTAYISIVHNQLLPLLRQTFGSQFTEREGERLEATLGNPNLSPPEKDAALKEFISQKMLHIQSMQREVGMGGGQIPQMDANQLNQAPTGQNPIPPTPDQINQQSGASHSYDATTGQLVPIQ